MNFISDFKPVMFLDIDGCLATRKEYATNQQKYWNKNTIANELKIPYPYNEKCVKIFNSILKETDAQIILSSDWKHHWSLSEMDKIFKLNKITKSPQDVTPDFNVSPNDLARNRAYEIQSYITKRRLWWYVVVDDLDLSPYFGIDKFVRTRELEGFKQCGVKDKIVKIIGKR